MPYRWFITDVDGTLLDEANELSPENRAALEHCRARGIPVVLATGRRWTTLRRVLDRLDLRGLVDFVIINNGMVIKDLKALKILHHETFDPAAIRAAVGALNALGWDPLALAYEAEGGPDVYHRRLSLRNGDFTAKNDGYCVLLNDYEELAGRAVVELILLGSQAELARAQASLAGLPLETALIKNTFYADYMLEITPRDVSKLTGARRLGAHLGLDVAEAVAIGDSANDLPLLREAGRAVAMPLAPEDVRARAHETGTVSDTVRRYFP
ncbi:MAG: putative haloacid dehalogenase-like hydrolase [Fibrobacteria bacterium]|jgi:Cof subfamily protein (haloacid dehalogenase superfamily)|nr:putative haloacid dehalogenase-like hydrolase [Fibrobacteria bacterium]